VTRSHTEFGKPARALLALLDWVPARLTALSFAVVGDFEDAAYCWRIQAKTWPTTEGGEPIGTVLASGAGALGLQIGGPLQQLVGEPYYRPDLGIGDAVQSDVLPSAVGLVWRALVLWLLLILLITLANWAP
jgi:adenosylcobinamide-phosphate synthase